MTAPTLTEFLLARIAEDEAEAASKPADWMYGYDDLGQGLTMRDFGPGYVLTVGPLRVLAECRAKRRIVERLQYTAEDHWSYGVLRDLTSVYADHPDYDEAWCP